jgi:hypothetical protein
MLTNFKHDATRLDWIEGKVELLDEKHVKSSRGLKRVAARKLELEGWRKEVLRSMRKKRRNSPQQ